LANTYELLGQYQLAIEFYQQWLDITRLIDDQNGEGLALSGLGNAYSGLGQYQQAVEFHQHSLLIRSKIGDCEGQANAYFNLGLTLERMNRKSQAMDAYCNARQLYQLKELDTSVQDCNDAIELLSQNAALKPSCSWYRQLLSRFWQL
jgi:tetratricopeptide (TPR) repeat protein